jgi:queuine tRNA-ribosyltransferase
MTRAIPFKIGNLCKSTSARTGTLEMARGTVQTPIFMPVGTQGAVRSLPPNLLREVGAQIILANTYHLHQRPGEGIVDKMGGLHKFMATDLPILTDSGGFQVFSLKKKAITEDGVAFTYEVDGKKTFLSPERSMEIQMALGSDIAMAFDECLAPEVRFPDVELSIERTRRWAERCVAAHTKEEQSLFGIVQGGMFPELRRRSAEQITSLGFDGFAIGGLSVGEGPELMNQILSATMPHMPAEHPRYLMGVGRPQDLVDGVAAGVDMFDCVIPTRHARSGTLYTFQGRIRVTQNQYRRDSYPVDTACSCYTCRNFSRAYLYHLFQIGEILGATLSTIHNLTFFSDMMTRVRASIADGTFASFRRDIKALYPEKTPEKTTPVGPVHDDAQPDTKFRDARTRMAKKAKPIPTGDVRPQGGGRALNREKRPGKDAARGPAKPGQATPDDRRPNKRGGPRPGGPSKPSRGGGGRRK